MNYRWVQIENIHYSTTFSTTRYTQHLYNRAIHPRVFFFLIVKYNNNIYTQTIFLNDMRIISCRVRGRTFSADNCTWCELRMIKPTAAECVKYCTGERLINDRQRCVPVSLSIVRKCLFCDRVAAAVYIMYCEHTCIYTHARHP